MIEQIETRIGMPRDKLEKFLLDMRNRPLAQDISQIVREVSHRPSGYAFDPRNKAIRPYCPSRSKRPNIYFGKSPCSICTGDTTPFILAKEISDNEYAFVNENPFPFLNPDGSEDILQRKDRLRGLHLMLWHSTEHKDIHELSYEDGKVTFDLLADLEEILVEVYGFQEVQVIKNSGLPVPDSGLHGCYQVAALNQIPKRIFDDLNFYEERNLSFSTDLQRINSHALKIKDYGTVVTMVPYCMRKPFEVIMCTKDRERVYPTENMANSFRYLSPEERFDFAKATSDISYTLSLLMPAMNMTFEYFFMAHTTILKDKSIGPMYMEATPSSQRDAGFERAGLGPVEGTPGHCAKVLQRFYDAYMEEHSRGITKKPDVFTVNEVRRKCLY